MNFNRSKFRVVKYSRRLKEDEQGWIDLGKSPEQALTNAYNNNRPPKKAPTEGEGGEEDGSAAGL